MEPTGNSTVSGERKPIKKTVATSATAKPNGKSTASSATVMKPNETTAVSSANSMNPNAVGAVKPEDSSASGVTQKPSPPVGSPAQAGQVRSGHLIVSAEFVFFELPRKWKPWREYGFHCCDEIMRVMIMIIIRCLDGIRVSGI
ncbi:unnamed protein product [Brassica rapa subsp. trilocularis]